jgi:hypothetical protein
MGMTAATRMKDTAEAGVDRDHSREEDRSADFVFTSAYRATARRLPMGIQEIRGFSVSTADKLDLSDVVAKLGISPAVAKAAIRLEAYPQGALVSLQIANTEHPLVVMRGVDVSVLQSKWPFVFSAESDARDRKASVEQPATPVRPSVQVVRKRSRAKAQPAQAEDTFVFDDAGLQPKSSHQSIDMDITQLASALGVPEADIVDMIAPADNADQTGSVLVLKPEHKI